MSFNHLVAFLILFCSQNYVLSNNFDDLNKLDFNLIEEQLARYVKNKKNFLNDQIYPENELQFKTINNRALKEYGIFVDSEDKKDPINKNNNLEINYFNPNNNNNLLANHGIRDQEMLEKSSLWRHQMMQGGAGEGEQKLKPDGSINNIQVIKTDSVIPSYCTPPNPCPLGYSSEDGCLEEFINTASYSRDYQSMQYCMCDLEHMFNCENVEKNLNEEFDENENNENKLTNNQNEEDEKDLNTIAQSLVNQPLGEEAANQLINLFVDHKIVAKKFFTKRKFNDHTSEQHLPIVAKKSPLF